MVSQTKCSIFEQTLNSLTFKDWIEDWYSTFEDLRHLNCASFMA